MHSSPRFFHYTHHSCSQPRTSVQSPSLGSQWLPQGSPPWLPQPPPSIFPRSRSSPALSGLDTCLQVQDTWPQAKVAAREEVTCPRSHRKPKPCWRPGQAHSRVTFRPWRCVAVAASQLAPAPHPAGAPISCSGWGGGPVAQLLSGRDGPGRKPLLTAPRFLGNCHCISSHPLSPHRGNNNNLTVVSTALCTFPKVLFICSLLGVSPELEWEIRQSLGSPIPRRINQGSEWLNHHLEVPQQSRSDWGQEPRPSVSPGLQSRTGVGAGRGASQGGSAHCQTAGQIEAQWRELG